MNLENVLVIHGLGQEKMSCMKIIKHLSKNFSCSFFSYKTNQTLPEIVDTLHEYLSVVNEYNCVTISFGAVVLRNYLYKYGAGRLKRCVMIGPPNKGSELLRQVMKRNIGRLMFGRLAEDFIKNEDKYLPLEPEFDVGIIAGDKPVISQSKAVSRYALKFFDPSDSDGKVKIEETKLPFMKDFILLPLCHEELHYNYNVINMTINYLKHGRFKDNKEKAG